MWEIIQAAGWPIWPLIIASIIARAIIGERSWALRAEVVAPSRLLPDRKSTRLNSSHSRRSRMPSSA